MIENNTEIKIIIADDHPMFRDGLKAAFSNEKDFNVINEASDGLEILELLKTDKPDVILMDITMPGIDGIDCAKILRMHYPDIKILLLTMHDDRQFILDALSIGVYGYILKMAPLERLVEAIKMVYKGDQYFDPDITSNLPSAYTETDENEVMSSAVNHFGLTPREFDVLILTASNYTAQETADKLCISYYTVCNHKKNIYKKLGIKHGSELVKFVIQHNLLKS